MPRIITVALAVLGGTLLGLGVASGATIRGTDRADRLRGTAADDALYGRGGNDRIDGAAGDDLLHGGPGRDTVAGNAGDDRIAVQVDRAADTVRCGAGRDAVTAELHDRIATDCEVLSRQLSRDPYRTFFDGQHETQVEPDSFAFGSTIVVAFQSGRYMNNGGAANIGWATSRDRGVTWQSGFLPTLTAEANPPGRYDRASDPVVAYDAEHGVWLISSLGIEGRSTALLISRSRDGLNWTAPVAAASDPREDYDKEWLVCDNWQSSPYRGRCYLTYLDFAVGRIATRRSGDGGLTWSAPVGSPGVAVSGTAMNGVQPIVRPNGALVILFSVFGSTLERDVNQIAAIHSTDGGVTFGPARRVATLENEEIRGVRSPPFTSVDIDRGGRIYAAWQDCRFREECAANEIVLSSSADGETWTPPRRVPTGPIAGAVDYFVPGLGVDRATSGDTARIAIAFHMLVPETECSVVDCSPSTIEVGIVTSTNGGRTWSDPQLLTTEPMPLFWIADTNIGRMLADYISTSFVGGRAVPVFSLASAPAGLEYRQAIYAGTRIGGIGGLRRR